MDDLAVDRHRHLTAHRDQLRIMDCLDGTNSIAAIAARVRLPFAEVRHFVDRLRAAGLVEFGGDEATRGLASFRPTADRDGLSL